MIERFFSPLTFDFFLQEYYEKKHLFLERGIDSNDYVLTHNEIDEFLCSDNIYYPSIKLYNNGQEVPRSEYTQNAIIGRHNIEGYVNNDKLFSFYNKNTTVIIESGQRYFRNLKKICLSLNSKFHCRINANIYITPPSSKGFLPHWDTHDVFILQIYGNKKWNLFGKRVELPTEKQTTNLADFDMSSPEVLDLKKGDLLYLPRGVVHSAETGNAASIHITIGIISTNWSNFFHEMFNELDNDIAFRKSLPLWDMELFEREYEQKIKLIENVLTAKNKYRAIDLFRNLSSHSRLQNNYLRFNSMLALNNIDLNTCIEINENIEIFKIPEKDTFSIKYYNKVISFPLDILEAMEYMFTQKKIVVSDIPFLDDESKCILVKKLIEEGVFHIFE